MAIVVIRHDLKQHLVFGLGAHLRVSIFSIVTIMVKLHGHSEALDVSRMASILDDMHDSSLLSMYISNELLLPDD